ncbi:hypothetical protein F2Q68_00006712 [Brassica cretica]|uniref:Uncharacterized protein n=1 Tax=Brassica cretica TaxID=69181 RepID=A0A8S9JM69_BRACR|nr:hypothetical protein F2Q68_00006712 [Brassica cretica]
MKQEFCLQLRACAGAMPLVFKVPINDKTTVRVNKIRSLHCNEASARDPSQLSTQTISASARIPDGPRSRSDVRDSIGATRPIPPRVSDQLQSARVQIAVSTHPTIKAFPISSCPDRG